MLVDTEKVLTLQTTAKPTKQLTHTILKVALSTPLRSTFDYLLPKRLEDCTLTPGIRLKVPFRNKCLTAVLLSTDNHTDVPIHKLKPIHSILDEQPVLNENLLQLAQWASDYYHHPIGEVIGNALPILLRQGEPAQFKQQRLWALNATGHATSADDFKRAPKQLAAWQLFCQHPQGLTVTQLKQFGITTPVLNSLCSKNLLQESTQDRQPALGCVTTTEPALSLNTDQSHAVAAICEQLEQFQTFLLQGVTGSGKTEVYLQCIAEVLSQNKQALILVPEIGLTPQTVARFQRRFGVPIAVFHSGLTDRERLDAWLLAKSGQAKIIIGTRSAIFTPLAQPGIIIIDESHDLSFKQQDGFRYSARDLAVVRGRLDNIPVILGSATPTLESIYNVSNGRYQRLTLSARAGNAKPPSFELIDTRNQSLQGGLSKQLIGLIKQHLQQQQQVLLFLNRRGFAPCLICNSCGWIANCRRCDARMTMHYSPSYLQCHHCGSTRNIDTHCPECASKSLQPLGAGTERLEQTLIELFPQTQITRIDRDTTRSKQALQAKLESINQGESQILVGTQMLAKGHHFPNVTLVAILDADSGFFSVDFRAPERMAQLLTQVSGRAGRGDKAGHVAIQTKNPEHPLLQELIQHDYTKFTEAALNERHSALLPPYSFMTLVRAEGMQQSAPNDFLKSVANIANALIDNTICLYGPVPAPMEKRAGRFRYQLLIQASSRQGLQKMLKQLISRVEQAKIANKIRWSIDVDPMEMY